MVRIDPDREHSIPSPSRTSDAAAPRDQGFASTLAAAREPAIADPRPGGAYEAIVARHRADPHATPLAERWGQYGRGATAAGYGEAPDPATLADVPVGRNAPAHPLNPEGTSGSTPPYDIPGFTARGTPIPPGFYNLAYYQRYLREGGTPIEGFPGYDPADGSLRDVYGSFGDGRARATSFVTATANAPEGPLHIAYEEKAPATSGAPSVETPPAAPAAVSVTTPAVAAAPAADAAAPGDALRAAARTLLTQLEQSTGAGPIDATLAHLLADLIRTA